MKNYTQSYSSRIPTIGNFELIKNYSIFKKSIRKFVPNEAFYRIETPFLMDSQAANWLNEKLGQSSGKRKRKRPSSTAGQAAPFLVEVFHREIYTIQNSRRMHMVW
jgi:hypothetical protein